MLFPIVIGAGALVLWAMFGRDDAKTPPAPARRRVVGKSGTTWFTAIVAVTPTAKTSEVYDSERGGLLVLRYSQPSSGPRAVLYQAPSQLGVVAKNDFI